MIALLLKARVLFRAALASGMGIKKILALTVQYAPLISAIILLFKKEKPSVEGLEESYHHAEETGDTSALEDVVREHRRDHRGGRLPKP